MPKLCNCGCENPVFSNKYAKFCQHKRTDEKWVKKMATQKGKNSQTSKSVKRFNNFNLPKTKPYSGVNDLNVKKESEMYEKIWNSRDRVSFLSGKPLVSEGSVFWHNQFAHILAKGKAKYPKFKLYSKNIILLTPEEHNLLDFCSSDDREKYGHRNNCDWNKVYNLQDELKNEYNLI